MNSTCNSKYTDENMKLTIEKMVNSISKIDCNEHSKKKQKCVNKEIMKYVHIPLTAASNLSIKRNSLNDSFLNQRFDYTGLAYDELNINIPSVFKKITQNTAILYGHTHTGSKVYTGKAAQNSVTCVMAIVMQKVRPVKSWLRSTLEDILVLGDKIYVDLKKKNPFLKNITSVDMNNWKVKVDNQKLIVNINVMTICGTVNSKIPSILNLRRALHTFFLTNNTGVVETSSVVTAVWKDEDFYYLFEPYQCDNLGRRINENELENSSKPVVKKEGKCCVVRFTDIATLTNLFISNSDRKHRNDYFVIKRITLTDDVPGAKNWHDFAPCVIGKFWILRGNIANDNDMFDEENRGIQGIAIPIVALIIVHQIPPAKWSANIIDEIVIEGDSYYYWCTHDQDDITKVLTVNNSKRKLLVKKRKIHIDIEDSVIFGNANDINLNNEINDLNIKDDLDKFFNEYQCTYGIIEINEFSIAIWKFEDEVNEEETLFAYYIFDPYPQHKFGNHLDNEGNGKLVACALRFLNLIDVAEYIERNFLDDAKMTHKSDLEYLIHNLNILSIGELLNDEDIEEDKLLFEKPDYHNYTAVNEEVAYLQGNFNQNNEIIFDEKTRDKQQSANAYVTLAMTKIYNPHLWRSEIVDDILRIGDKLTLKNLDNLPEFDEDDDEEPRVFLFPSEINSEFNLGVFRIKVNLEEESISGNVNNLEEILVSFFEDNSMGILYQNDVSIPLWKEGDIFFMMDPRGRDKTGVPNEKNGNASVIWTLTVSSLCFQLKLCLRDSDGLFVIDEFSIEDISKVDDENIEPVYDQSDDSWYSFKKISDSIWKITSDAQISDIKNHEQSVTISIIGILFSKMYKPHKLNVEILDEIILIGNKFYMNCKKTGIDNCSINLNNISRNLYFTNRHFKFTVFDCVEFGKLNSKHPRVLNLEKGLEKYFDKFNNGILIIDGSDHIAMFKVDEFYYCVLSHGEILRFSSVVVFSNEILHYYDQSEDYEISKIDIITQMVTFQADCTFMIGQLNLPPLNAFKQSEVIIHRKRLALKMVELHNTVDKSV